AYEGGGADLKNNDVIFSNGLNGPKARLKLLVGLSQDMTHNQLERYFEE
ncbi:asparaginase, partial [Staphylococcus lugdunensis]